jgi:hypothetical protein
MVRSVHQPNDISRFRTWLISGAATAALGLALSAGTAAQVSDFKLPPGYRDWRLVSVAILGAPFDDIRAKLGNDLAFTSLREGRTSFPNGAMIARLAWKQVSSEINNNAFRQDPSAEHLSPDGLQKLLSTSFAAGPPTNVQFMIKDSKKYASTGGWGFFQFTHGKPDRIVPTSCFACHAAQKATDFVFTRYSP